MKVLGLKLDMNDMVRITAAVGATMAQCALNPKDENDIKEAAELMVLYRKLALAISEAEQTNDDEKTCKAKS